MNPARNLAGSGKVSLADLQAAGVGSVIEVPVAFSYFDSQPGTALLVGFSARAGKNFVRVRLAYRGAYHKCPKDGWSEKVKSVRVEQVISIVQPATAPQEAPA